MSAVYEIKMHFAGTLLGTPRELGALLHERLAFVILQRAAREWPEHQRDQMRADATRGLIGDAVAWMQVVAGAEATVKMLDELRDVVQTTAAELAAERSGRVH